MSFQFNEAYYLEQNPDVAAAVANGSISSALSHWQNIGFKENRNPNENFNTADYLEANPDVAAAVENGMNPLNHFLNLGAAEGRAPSAEYQEVAANFDAEAYLSNNPDVAAAIEAGANLNAYKHWVLFGQFEEGRPEATLTDGRTVEEAVAEFNAPTLTLAEALETEELPELYNIDTTAVVEAGEVTVAEAQEAFAAVTAVLEGAANQEELAEAELFTWNIVDDADAIIAVIEDAAVTGATTVMVSNETLTQAQFDALSVLENVNLEGVVIAEVSAISLDSEDALLTDADSVLAEDDSITDVDGFGEGATVTLAYGEAVAAAGEFGTPSIDAGEFRVARDGNTFTLIAEGDANGFEADTAIGTVTPVGLVEVLNEAGEGTGNYTQTGYTIELTADVTPEVLTALLQQWGVQEAADGSNTTLTVNVAPQDGAEPLEFVRTVAGDDAGGIVLNNGNELAALEAELTAGALDTEAADAPFAPFGTGLIVANEDLIDGMTVTMASDNAGDAFSFGDADNGFEAINGQLIFGTPGNDTVVADITGLGTNEVTITFRGDVGLVADDVNALLNNLELDLVDEVSERSVSLNVTSADGLATDSLTRDISVLGEFTAVSLTDIQDADIATDAESAITVDGNTILNIGSFGGALDIQAQIDAGNLILGESNTIRVVADAAADLSEVVGLDLLGDLQIQTVETGTLTLNATQVDFLSTASEVAGDIAVVALEDNLDADFSVLEAANVTAEISADAGDVTFTGDFGTADVTVGANSTLTATAAILSEVTVDGAVVVSDLDGEAAYDLAGLNSATAVLAAGEVTTLNEDTDLGTVAVTVPQNSELVLTADQANGANIAGGDVNGTGNKGGSVTVLGLTDGVDLSDIAVSEVLAGAVNATQSDLIATVSEDTDLSAGDPENFGAFNVQVEEGVTLTLDAASLDNGEDEPTSITGAGNVTVELAEEAFDLSNVEVAGEKVANVAEDIDVSDVEAIFGDFSVNVAADATLILSAAQASDLTITGEAGAAETAQDAKDETTGGSIVVELDGDAAYNFASITAGAGYVEGEETVGEGALTATIAETTTLNADTNLGEIASITIDTSAGADLTLSATQADGLTVSGTANVVEENTVVTVNDLGAETDLSNIVPGDESGVDELIANVSGMLDVSSNANLDSVTEFRVTNDAELTLSARQASEQVVKVAAAVEADEQNDVEAQAAGAVVIAGPVELEEGEDALDLDFSDVEAFTFQGDELVIGEGVTVTLTAAQASGKVITGAGNVIVTGLEAATDLSGIAVTGDMTTTVTENLTLESAADLGDFAVNVAGGVTFTLTAAQASELETLEGDGSVIINGSEVANTLDFSEKTWTVASLTINGNGGADILEGPANFEGELILNGNSNADTFVVSSGEAIIGDFQAGVDELLVSEGATAVMTLQADTDLSTLQAAELIDIKGTLRIDLNGFNLTATETQLANIEVEDTLENLLTIAGQSTASDKVVLTADAVFANDIGEDGEEVAFNNEETDLEATTIDFVDDEATLTLQQLELVAGENGLALTALDEITVTGVKDATDLTYVGNELGDNDTIEVDDESTITLNVSQLNILESTVTAQTDGPNADATVTVTVANSETAERATDLVDTFQTAETAGETYTIDGTALETGDKIDLGIAASTYTDGTDDSALEVSAVFENGNTTFSVETATNGAATADYTIVVEGVNLTGVALVDGVVTIA